MDLSYQDLIAWQKAMNLAEEIYTATRTFPKDELYGLPAQLRPAAISIPSNIAEGQGRMTSGKFRQFLGDARGSLLETETQILMAGRLLSSGRRDRPFIEVVDRSRANVKWIHSVDLECAAV